PATSGPPSNGVCPHSTNKVRLKQLRRRQWLQRFYQLRRLQRAVPPGRRGTDPGRPARAYPTGSVPTAPLRSGWSDYGDNSGCTGFISYTGCSEQSPSRKGTDPGRPTGAHPTGSVPTAVTWSSWSDDNGHNGHNSRTDRFANFPQFDLAAGILQSGLSGTDIPHSDAAGAHPFQTQRHQLHDSPHPLPARSVKISRHDLN
ncbi:MAG: hypothetical protein RL215_1456, partial [Planctomycetota bacterium]